MTAVDRYRDWWPWLLGFDATTLAEGERWACTLRPPVPYVVRFTVELVEVVPCERVVATLSGDLRGSATLTLAERAGGCELALSSDLEAMRGPVASLSRWLPDVTRWCHDHVLDVGIERFAAQVARRELS